RLSSRPTGGGRCRRRVEESPARSPERRGRYARPSGELGRFHMHGRIWSAFIVERGCVMSTALSIAFTGLCAIIGNGDGKPAEILLLDTRGVGEVRGVALPRHAPTLVVDLRDLANPSSSAPDRVVTSAPGRASSGEQLGLWDLTGTEVRIHA